MAVNFLTGAVSGVEEAEARLDTAGEALGQVGTGLRYTLSRQPSFFRSAAIHGSRVSAQQWKAGKRSEETIFTDGTEKQNVW